MLDCVKVVDKHWINLGRAGRLFTKSTSPAKYLIGQLFFGHSFSACYEQVLGVYRQVDLSILNLLVLSLCPLSTVPINTTNLIKD